MRDCRLWLGFPHDNRNRPRSVSSQVLREIIKKEMRRAKGRDTLKAKRDLMAKNLRDMFTVQELSYVVYMRLISLLEKEYARAIDKIVKGEEQHRKVKTK